MNLKEFVSDTLCQIAEGVCDAQGRFAELGGYVNPVTHKTFVGKTDFFYVESDKNGKYIFNTVRFDVVLGEEKSKTSNKRLVGVLLRAIGGEVENENENATSSVTRVQFSVPVILPSHKLTE